MTAFDLTEWRNRLRLSQASAATALGCSKTSIVCWEKGQPIPRYIALACAAIAYGLPPYR
ncbi:helix-turn-helix domain-containing protein [Rhizobium lusitanum]|uniref:Helix-turn-helix domain-containing protein n=1 Tax=Rhizobium lusitanum TaxID=293958 RepID=A0A6L9U9K4_9HYPH|nr:helix-turn-helix domain-containing protein [Rhizobium lusitanum]